MDKLALTLPGWTTPFPTPTNLKPGFDSLGSVVSGVLDVAFMVATFLAFIWLAWGAFHYIFAGGDKEQLKKARDRITWAIAGLIITALSFALAQFIEQVLGPRQQSPISFLVTTVYAADPVDLSTVYDFGIINSLGEGISRLVMPAFSIAATAVTIYLVIGGFRFLTSGGDKEGIAKAREMITHAIIGFLLLIFIFLIMQFIPEVFGFRFSLF